MWEGERLVPDGWVERSVTPWVADINPDNGRKDSGYGYKWWILEDGEGDAPKVYAAMGYGGQFLLVVPELELIGVFNAWNIFGQSSQATTRAFVDRIVPTARR